MTNQSHEDGSSANYRNVVCIKHITVDNIILVE